MEVTRVLMTSDKIDVLYELNLGRKTQKTNVLSTYLQFLLMKAY